MRKRILKRAGFGFVFGIAICTVITVLVGSPDLVSPEFVKLIGNHKAATIIQLLLSGLYGAIAMAGTLLYDSDRLPMTAATAIHCTMVIVPFIPMALLLHWIVGVEGALIMAGIQLAGFFIIWLILFARYKAEIKKLNELQEKKTGGSK